MTQNVAWVVLALGAVALGFSLLHVSQLRSAGTVDLKPYLLSAAFLLFGGALLTLPTGKPWSPGQTLAPGFVLGGFAVLAAAAAPIRTSLSGMDLERYRYFWAALQVSASVLGVGVLLVVTPQAITDALGGFALGAVTAGLVLTGGALLGFGTAATDSAWGTELATLAAITLATTTHLAALHRGPSGQREWTALPGLLAAALAVGLNVRAILSRGTGSGWAGTLLGVFVPVGLIAWVSAYHLHGSPALLWNLAAGVVLFGLAAWLEAAPASGADDAPTGLRRWPLRVDVGLLTALLSLGAALLAFRKLHGYGVSLTALGGLVVLAALPAPSEEAPRERPVLRGGLVLLLLLSLYRIYTDRYESARGFNPDEHYYFAALIAGALLPALLAGSTFQWMREVWGAEVPATPEGPRRTPSVLLRVALAGLGALAAPLLVWVLLNASAQSAFLVGLAVGAAFLLSGPISGWGGGTGAGERSFSRLLGLAMALSAVQFTHLLDLLGDLTRHQRAGILALVVAVALLGVLVTALRERRVTAARAAI